MDGNHKFSWSTLNKRLAIVAAALIVIVGTMVFFFINGSSKKATSNDAASTALISAKTATVGKAQSTDLLTEVKNLGLWDSLSAEQKSFVLANSTKKCSVNFAYNAGSGNLVQIVDSVNNKVIIQAPIKHCSGGNNRICGGGGKITPSTIIVRTPASLSQVNSPSKPSGHKPSKPSKPSNINININNNNTNNNVNNNSTTQNNSTSTSPSSSSSSPSSSSPSSSSPSSSSPSSSSPSSSSTPVQATSKINFGQSTYRSCDAAGGIQVQLKIKLSDASISTSVVQAALQHQGLQLSDSVSEKDGLYTAWFYIPSQAGTYTVTLAETSQFKGTSAQVTIQ